MNIDWLTPYLAIIPVLLLLASTSLSQRTDRSLSEVEGNGRRSFRPFDKLRPSLRSTSAGITGLFS